MVETGEATGELQVELEGLRKKVCRGRRRSVLLTYGTLAALALGLICWGAYYNSSVLSFAEVEDVGIRRDSTDPDRVTLVYHPRSSGRIGFRRADGDRETELFEEVVPASIGRQQQFEWRVRGIQAGDVIKVTYLDGWSLAGEELDVPELPSRAGQSASGGLRGGQRPGTDGVPRSVATVRLGDAVLRGQIINAINKQPVPGAVVRILGTAAAVQTGVDGLFRISGAPVGEKWIEVAAEGFTTDRAKRPLDSGRETSHRVVLSPGLEEGQIRLVLTWDQQPEDLDAHLEGPLPGNEEFHVYYHQPGDLKSREYVRLDVDARDGNGPETITVLGIQPGVYRYYVHDYTNRDDPKRTALARSGAEVKLYHGLQTYRFRAGHDMEGNIWDVCTFEVTDAGAVVNEVDQYRGLELETLGLYAKRTQADRQKWITNYGGSVVSEKAVSDGLDWLARHQDDDGSWSDYCLGRGSRSRCDRSSPCTGEGDAYEMALTGLALLAFQAGGHYYFNDAEYSELVGKGLDWMVEHQWDDGALVGSKSAKSFSGAPTYHKYHMYEHGIAAFALTDACAAAANLYATENEQYKKYLAAAEKAIRFIEKNQHLDGGWRYTNNLTLPGDTSVTGWQILAMKSAKEAGIPVTPKCVEDVRTFFESREMGENGRTGYDDRLPNTDATTGVGMLAKQFILNEPDAPLVGEAAQYLARLAEMQWGDRQDSHDNRDYYLWYNCTLAMFQVGGEFWNRWNGVIRDTLITLQRHEGCERGSWDPNSKWGRFGGRIYSTALAVLTLEVYYRYAHHEEIGAGAVQLHVGPEGAASRGVRAEPEPAWLPTREPGDKPPEMKLDIRENDQEPRASGELDE